MTEAEQQVREAWKLPQLVGEDGDCCIALELEVACNAIPPDYTVQSAWQAALEFTLRRKAEIRKLEEEVRLLEWMFLCSILDPLEHPVYGRILARENKALVELKRGMK